MLAHPKHVSLKPEYLLASQIIFEQHGIINLIILGYDISIQKSTGVITYQIISRMESHPPARLLQEWSDTHKVWLPVRDTDPQAITKTVNQILIDLSNLLKCLQEQIIPQLPSIKSKEKSPWGRIKILADTVHNQGRVKPCEDISEPLF